MAHELPPLPYARDALEPFMSAQTLAHHHGEHHRKYVETLNKLIAGTKFESMSLGEIIQRSADEKDHRKIFNNAAQHWNHTFFWNCMKPHGGGAASKGALASRIEADFGSFETFAKAFKDEAVGHFGSGWVWLVADAGKLKVVSTHDGDNPIVHGQHPLLTCDLWEHAYYLDYQHRRADFVAAFLGHLVRWEFATEQLAMQGEGNATAARVYDDAAAKHAVSGDARQQAEAARRAVEGPEGESLREAEQVGRSHAAEEDRLLKKRAGR
jgi:Fe-Mn family superoxide dismutase